MKAAHTAVMKRLFQPSTRKSLADPTHTHGHKIRIVSYNILADKYSSFNTYCPPEFLAWSYRCPRILQELQSYNPDIVCLQEVEQQVFKQQLQPWMQQHGYQSLFHPRRSTSGLAETDDGVSLHFRTDMFRQIDSTACCRKHRHSKFVQRLRQREEGCVMALLQHLPSQTRLVVVSTHLFWNPLFPDVKVTQAAIMCSCIAKFLQRHGSSAADMPVAIGGDFNSLWQKYQSDHWDQVPKGQTLQSGVYQLMQQGQLPPSHQDHPGSRSCARCSSSQGQQAQQQRQWRQEQQSQQPHLNVSAGFAPELWGSESSMETDSAGSSVDEPYAAVSAAAGGDQPPGGPSTIIDYTFTTAGLQLDSSYRMAHGREPPPHHAH